jgi:O-antigen/teichoic acid export membrane protein
VFGLLLALVMLARVVPEFRWRGARSSLIHAREALAFGGPMQLASLMAVVHIQADKFLLPVFVTLAAVTPYELGSRVLGSVMAFPQLLLLAVLPAAAALHAAGESGRLRELYQRGDRYVLTATAVALAVLIGSADRLYATWLGPGHADAALVLRGLALAAGFVLATGMASVTARAVGRTDLEAWFGGISVVLHVVLSVILLPRFGLPGTLVAVFVANLAGSLVFLLMVSRTVGWPAWEVLAKPHGVPALATLAGAAAGLILDRHLHAAGGLMAWLQLVAVAMAAGLVALGVATTTGYFRWREARALLAPAPRRVGDPPGSGP